jgi:hypothetical protein
MQPTIPNTRDFEIMLEIVPIDGIGLSCVALEIRDERYFTTGDFITVTRKSRVTTVIKYSK